MAEITKTLGGDRLGSGNKQKTRLHNYERSTHELSESFKSSAGVGMLIPCYCNVATNGDTFEFNINAGIKTIPSQGPLFSSYKFQLDMFACPIRLYQGILHNNPMNIGLKMNQVLLPKIRFKQRQRKVSETAEEYKNAVEFATNSLEKYLGLSGIGVNLLTGNGTIKRDIQCVPELAYFDIFKNYYANKQEEKAYIISNESGEILNNIYTNVSLWTPGGEHQEIEAEDNKIVADIAKFETDYQDKLQEINIACTRGRYNRKKCILAFSSASMYAKHEIQWFINNGAIYDYTENENGCSFKTIYNTASLKMYVYNDATPMKYSTDVKLVPFDIENIDKMRYDILAQTTFGSGLIIEQKGEYDYLPYSVLCKTDEATGLSANTQQLNGILVKTYQSDLFNNWVQTEWIDGENGINAITSVQTNTGSFTIDALNLASKVYNMLNRIAVSGGTYQDWQEAVYAERAVNHSETPIYLGGMSSEVEFDEVVSTAATNEDALGTLGGRGRLAGKKGGHIIFKCTEPTFIIGIMSITPRIDQTQGNAWYRTELSSVDDLHKPELDQVGFQDLLEEQMAWWAAKPDTNGDLGTRAAVGKVPAWINYMTAVDKAYGDFAKQDGYSYMILGRNYTMDTNNALIKDATTYIDPTKFNYVFAYTELQAQNFWVQIYFDVKARRKMSAKQIPNL